MRLPVRLALLTFLLLALRAVAAPPAGYYLVWGDEFSGSSLDPTKWWVWNQQDRSGYSVPDAVTVSNGYMTILVYSTNGQNYSGIVSSDGHFRARYGYSEASVEFNGSPGMFSDYRINSANNGQFIGDPAAEGAEVDICEHRVTDASNLDNIAGNVTIDLHWNGYGTSKSTFNSPLYGSGLGSGFHTYSLLWSSNNYQASIDGVPTLTTNAGVSQRTEIVLFSCEVDSNSFCGIVPPGGYGNANVSTTATVVDYFRFYAPTTTVYWLGGSSASFSDGGNWLSNMIPTAASDVVFSYLTTGNFNVVLGSNTAINSLSIQETSPVTISGGTLTLGAGGIDLYSALNNPQINSPIVLAASQAWNTTLGIALYVNTNVSGAGNLSIGGYGAVAMQGADTSTGTTTVKGGTLYANGTMTGPITVAGGTLSGTGTMTGAVSVNSGLLTGNATLTSPVTVSHGGTIAPGSPTGALTISNTLTLQAGSITLINVNKTTGACGQISGLSSIAFGGTLVVSNLSGTLAPGDSFAVFNAAAYSGAFSRISPATPGAGLVWDTADLAANGILRVVSTSNAVLTAQAAGAQVNLAWPLNNLGWVLQTQTNPPGVGITTNWITVPGTAGTNGIQITVNPNVGSAYYRLVSPGYSTAIFAAGDLIVLQVGNGSIANTGAPGVLKDFSIFGGSSLAQVALPTTGANALIFGASSYDGALSLSGDGQWLVVPGYNVAVGAVSSAIDSSSTSGGTPVPRAVGSVNANGTFILNATTTQFSGSTIRSGAADGAGNFWAGGGSSGIVYLGTTAPAATVSGVSSSTRETAFINGNLYFTETGSGIGLMGFSGGPTGAATPSMVISTTLTGSGSASPKGFAINPAAIAYIADNRNASSGGGVQRFNWNGSSWVYAYTLGNSVTSSTQVDDIAVDFSGANPVIYAVTGESTGNHIIKATDTGAASTFSSIETAQSGDAFRGIVLAPASW
jgi:hypothetical protein